MLSFYHMHNYDDAGHCKDEEEEIHFRQSVQKFDCVIQKEKEKRNLIKCLFHPNEMAVRSKALTIRQGGLLDSAAEGSHHVHAVGLHSQLVAGEGLQRHQQQLLSRAANRMWCYNTGRVGFSTHDRSM